ncbi:MAG: tRNA guanosine(34) transglycosylase Tgt [Phycisphaeraceae bacterium]
MSLAFEILHHDATSRARLGRVTTPHGSFDTPAFMPVGTQGTVKGLLPTQVAATGTQILLANTYHLMLRPGSELVAQMGGLHQWMGWAGSILTDSGGYQVYSLADISRIDEAGVHFRSHIDGAAIDLTPERAIQVQNELGADIIMAFDDCPPAAAAGSGIRDPDTGPDPNPGIRNPKLDRPRVAPADYPARLRLANERTVRWLERCIRAHGRPGEQALFGIVQGGTDLAQRDWCLDRVAGFDLPGYAIGGVAVGEGHDELCRVVRHVAPRLPAERPRYLMGVGYERDILVAAQAGVDMFDCVLPTRNGRSACAFTSTGQIRLKNARFREDPGPIEPGCDCIACGAGAAGSGSRDPGLPNPDPGTRNPDSAAPAFSRSYLRHLFLAGEMLGPMLVSAHNIRHFQRYLLDIRQAIRQNDWSFVLRRWPVAGVAAVARQPVEGLGE